jgi:hypothetical protein
MRKSVFISKGHFNAWFGEEPVCCGRLKSLEAFSSPPPTSSGDSLFQTILLHDDIILPHYSYGGEHEVLLKTGFFKENTARALYVDTSSGSPVACGFSAPTLEEYEEMIPYLKPALLPSFAEWLAEKLSQHYYYKTIEFESEFKDVDFYGIASALYYYFLEEADVGFQVNNHKTLEIAKKVYDLLGADFVGGVFWRTYYDAYNLLDHSHELNAEIFNCPYDIEKIGYGLSSKESESSDKTTMEAYRILRVKCKDAIVNLPSFRNLAELIKFKEKRCKDIQNLRHEVSNIEHELRTNGNEKAIETAALSVNKASKVLTKGVDSSKVEQWTNRLIVPAEIVAICTESVPLAVGAVLLKWASDEVIMGAINALVKRNGWLEAVI